MEGLINKAYEYIKTSSPLIVAGILGSMINRIRNNMSWKQFIGSIIISIFVSFVVGIMLKNFTRFNEEMVFIFCGISGTFSKIILDALEEFFKEDLWDALRCKIGLKPKYNKKDDKND